MKFFNLGLPEIIFIVVLALILLGPGNMVKSAREVGAFIRRITRSPYWQEVWATRREINEIPRMLAREANLDETIRDLDRQSRGVQSSLTSSVADLIKEVEEPKKDNRADMNRESPDLHKAPEPPAERE
jgi:Sec-independent protein translocase protein TatA